MNTELDQDVYFMKEALEQARIAAAQGEVPVGAVVVFENRVVARAFNRREVSNKPSAHAEFLAIEQAAAVLGRWRLYGCTVYVTLEPCCMCAGLMVNARIDRCVFGASEPKAGATGSLLSLHNATGLNHSFSVRAGVLKQECSDLLRDFFKARRDEGTARSEGYGAGSVSCVTCAPNNIPAHQNGQTDSLRIMLIATHVGKQSADEVINQVEAGIHSVTDTVRVYPVVLGTAVDELRAGLGMCDCHANYSVVRTNYTHATLWLDRQSDAQASRALIQSHAEAMSGAFSHGTVGTCIAQACAADAHTIIVVLDSYSVSHAGLEVLSALGVRFYDEDGCSIAARCVHEETVASIDIDPAARLLHGRDLIVTTDCRQTLGMYGPRAVRWGRLLDEARARALTSGELKLPPRGRRFRSVLGVLGSGAGEGLAASLLACGARIEHASSLVLEQDEVLQQLMTCDAVVCVGSSASECGVFNPVITRIRQNHVPLVAWGGSSAHEESWWYEKGAHVVLGDTLPADAPTDSLHHFGETVARVALLLHTRRSSTL